MKRTLKILAAVSTMGVAMFAPCGLWAGSLPSDDKAEQSAVDEIASKWTVVNVAWSGGTLTMNVGRKGNVKVSGCLADGTKVSAKSQLIIGDSWSSVPVEWARGDKTLKFTLWLKHDGGESSVEGLDSAKVGLPAALETGAQFNIDTDALCTLLGDSTYKAYLPSGVSVVQNDTKWTLPKAGRVRLDRSGNVDLSKLGENPSGLRLSYRAQRGIFTGTFRAYVLSGSRPKSKAVGVTGVMVGGKGFGMAIVKKVGSVPVYIEAVSSGDEGRVQQGSSPAQPIGPESSPSAPNPPVGPESPTPPSRD